MIQENVCQRKPVFWDILCSETLVGSSQRKCSIKESFLKNFKKFTGKHLLQSLFYIKLQTWALQLSYKKDWYRCFPSNFAKFFIFWKTSFLQNTSRRLLLIIAVGLELHRNKFKFIISGGGCKTCSPLYKCFKQLNLACTAIFFCFC